MHNINHPRSPIISVIGFLVFALSTTVAQAQTLTRDGTQDRNDKNHITIGAGAAYAPAYEGADKYRVLPVPAVDAVWGPFFVNLRNGIGINAIDTKFVTVGASVTYLPGYRRRDVPNGIGKLSDSVGGRGFVALRARGVTATLGVTQSLSGGTKGLIADASLSYPISVSSRLMLIPTVGTTWADKKHNDRYFGVNTEQSLASGLPNFHAGSGFKDVSAILTASYRLTDHFNLSASGGVTSLLGNVQDSPLVVHKTQPFGFMALSYRFGL
jgi:outer membrane protein